MTQNQLILIADDFGLSQGINQGIRDLLSHRRISGTSAMVNMPDFDKSADQLALFRESAELGLHLNLTQGRPLSAMPNFAPSGEFPSLLNVISDTLLNRIHRHEIIDEITRQIAHFKSRMGFLPHFIDGHQHVHIFPFVRSALFSAIQSFEGFSPWIRIPAVNRYDFSGAGSEQ